MTKPNRKYIVKNPKTGKYVMRASVKGLPSGTPVILMFLGNDGKYYTTGETARVK